MPTLPALVTPVSLSDEKNWHRYHSQVSVFTFQSVRMVNWFILSGGQLAGPLYHLAIAEGLTMRQITLNTEYYKVSI